MSADDTDTDVLIAGAGPTGLVLALCLRRLGVRFRLVDRALAPGTTSRALVVHARTLEFYRQLGVADAVVTAAVKFMAVNLWVGGRRRARMAFGDIGETLSAYPYSLIFPQDEHERVLVEALRERGVGVERGIELVDVLPNGADVTCTLRAADGTEQRCRARYVAGCDGAHSAVRRALRIGLPGGTYSHVWYVADVVVDGPVVNHEVNITMDERDVLAIFPMGDHGARLVGQAPPPRGSDQVRWDDVDQRLLRQLRTRVSKVNWFSTYRVHHRVASAFSDGSGFLLGDAAHLHSPVGGQGMNTGIGDAMNLGWKLAEVLRGEASPQLLESYDPERIAFARGLVATTDHVFAILNGDGLFSRVFRTTIAPLVLPRLFGTRVGRRLAFRLLSQISVRYRRSPLSCGRAGGVHAGDRLPWIATPGDPSGFPDTFAPFDAFAWHVQSYGEPSPALARCCARHGIPLHRFAWRTAMRRDGLRRAAIYLIRPDGHVAFAGTDVAAFERYVRESPVRFGAAAGVSDSAPGDDSA
jgi:2-polyprenyl-6-methoxyphenol hydroxylase-like FAD-dependent oxidoreductase